MKRFILIILLLIGLLSSGCGSSRSFDSQLNLIAKPYRFSIAGWELKTLTDEIRQAIPGKQENTDNETQSVIDYFTTTERNAALTNTVERIIEKQIRETLVQQAIFNPIDSVRLKVGFPPVNFKLVKMPYLLVISPRERIESMREIILTPNLTLEEIEDIEARIDELGVSSLVVGLGGLGITLPTMVANSSSLRFTIDATAEEWLHQYLAFKPLGFRYLLDLVGLSRNYEIAVMNETLACMVSKEIGSIVYDKYYSGYESNDSHKGQAPSTEFDFNLEMREIRKAVDSYLAQGEIEQAEEFMEQKRQYLASNGYYIRKLNQAYFAFHGAYADSPTSIHPIGVELRTLRTQTTSLKDFLDKIAAMTSRRQLTDSIK